MYLSADKTEYLPITYNRPVFPPPPPLSGAPWCCSDDSKAPAPHHLPEVIIIVIVIKIGISTLPFFWQSVEIPLILELPAFLFIFP